MHKILGSGWRLTTIWVCSKFAQRTTVVNGGWSGPSLGWSKILKDRRREKDAITIADFVFIELHGLYV